MLYVTATTKHTTNKQAADDIQSAKQQADEFLNNMPDDNLQHPIDLTNVCSVFRSVSLFVCLVSVVCLFLTCVCLYREQTRADFGAQLAWIACSFSAL